MKDIKIRKKESLCKSKKSRCFMTAFTVISCIWCLTLTPIAATSSTIANETPLTVINNLSDFIFGLVRAIGMILLGFGVVQIGLSLKSHDPSQRANGFLTLAGGVIITFAKEILNLIIT